MSVPSTGLFQSLRNIQRKVSNTPFNSDLITSAKELKRIRSTQQINVTTFMDVNIHNDNNIE
jgi:hypothetical protein